MSRRVQFQTLASPAPAAAPFADSVPEVGTGYKKYLQKLDEMEAKYSRKRPRKAPKKKKPRKKKTYGRTKRLQRWYRDMKRTKRHGSSKTGVPLMSKTTLKRIVSKLPWANKPLSTLIGVEGWLDRRNTLASLFQRIPQGKQRVITVCGIKGCS